MNDYESIFRDIEESSQCAGICSNPGFYVFSNVNNGVPNITCQSALEKKLVDRVVYLLAANLSVTILTSIIQLVLYLILVKRIYTRCCKKRKEERKLRKD